LILEPETKELFWVPEAALLLANSSFESLWKKNGIELTATFTVISLDEHCGKKVCHATSFHFEMHIAGVY
jgi:hypothetical protein